MPDSTETSTPAAPETRTKGAWLNALKPFLFPALGGLVLYFLFGQIQDGGAMLDQLKDAATARGLITLVLATATVAAAIILVLAAIVSEGSEADLKMRLSEGRQVLAPLIGILGTVVGFYFGQAPANPGPPAAGTAGGQVLRLENLSVSPEQVAPGLPVTVNATILGGTPPYRYSISWPGLDKPVAGRSAEGAITQEVTVPKDAKTGSVTVQVDVTDEKNGAASAKTPRPLRVSGS